jgi:hypothetical protein
MQMAIWQKKKSWHEAVFAQRVSVLSRQKCQIEIETQNASSNHSHFSSSFSYQ